jgi:hypothetical protein
MKHLLSKLKNKKGSGIVTVMVAVLFLTAFGTLSLYLTYTSTEMVAAERKGNEVSYNAETCMDEIRAGLQIIVSDAITRSYNQIMPRYTSNNQNIGAEFHRLYLDNLLNAKVIDYRNTVHPASGTDVPAAGEVVYLTEKLFGDNTYNASQLVKLVQETRNGECHVYSGSPGNENGILEQTEKELILKDITVSYVDSSGRKSSITTDISIGIPDIGYYLTQYSISGIPDFTLIAKGKILQKSVTGKNVNIFGNAYANDIELENDNTLTVGAGGTMIVKEDISLKGNITADRFRIMPNATLWAGNITIGDATKANLSGRTYVQNDLAFTGANSTVILGGKDANGDSVGEYYGFGCDDSKPGSSSSIIFNHETETTERNTLDLSDVQQLTLAGVSFVSNYDKNKIAKEQIFAVNSPQLIDPDSTPTDIGQDKIGARTGMSVDTKLNQLIYFAPRGEVKAYVHEEIPASIDGTTKQLVKMKQSSPSAPLYYADYNKGNPIFYRVDGENGLVVDNTYDDYDPVVTARALTADTDGIAFYNKENLNKIEYFALNGETYKYSKTQKEYVIETPSDESFPASLYMPGKYSDYGITLMPIYQPLSGGMYEVTFFLHFPDQDSANRYFKDYYDAKDESGKYVHRDTIQKNIDSYMELVNSADATEFKNKIKSYGNLLTKGTGTDKYGIIEAARGSFNALKNQSAELSNIFKQYCICLSSKPVNTLADNPYDCYINEDKILADTTTSRTQLTFYSDGKPVAIVKRGNYTDTPADTVCIIVATGNVTVNKDFNGVIFSGGNITLANNSTLNKYADGVAVAYNSDTISTAHVHDSTATGEGGIPDRLLKEYFNFNILENTSSTDDPISGEAWNVERLVAYRNWRR